MGNNVRDGPGLGVQDTYGSRPTEYTQVSHCRPGLVADE